MKGKPAQARREYMGPVLEPWQVSPYVGETDDFLSNDFTIVARNGEVVAGGLTAITARHVVEIHNRWLEMEAI